ncbi:IS66 Orf2 like protein [compost metagenome]
MSYAEWCAPRSRFRRSAYPKSMDFRKSIDDLAALIELDIKVAVFDPVLFVFLKRARCFTS